MGMVFGKVDVAEPAYDVLLSSDPSAPLSWEVRRYGTRFAIEAEYTKLPDGKHGEDRAPFMELAGYIGVVGKPENDGGKTIAMTAPVAIENENSPPAGTKIAMTAPVAIENEGGGGDSVKKMQFWLPAEYDAISKIPKPTNPHVKVVEVPPAVGAVHRYNGAFNEGRSKGMAEKLVDQLKKDGLKVDEGGERELMGTYQSWGYNPPFTINYFKRNEVWVPLTENQVRELGGVLPEELEEVKN